MALNSKKPSSSSSPQHPAMDVSNGDYVDYDEEKQSAAAPQDASSQPNQGLQIKLNRRHLTFISLGSVIGTGIFLGVGEALQTAGPIGLILAFAVICSVVFCVMLCTGEMVTYLPVVGAHLRLSGRFVDPSLEAAMSWNYWYCWALIAAAEASAFSVLVTYWTTDISPAVWISICLGIALAINLCGPLVYAEIEFYMSTIKVLTIVGLILLSIILDAGGGPNGDVIGIRYWKNPGPFVQYLGVEGSLGRFLGFFSGLTTAAFSSIGAEMLALVAAETKNPRKTVPQALRATWVRVVLFYFLGAVCVSLIVPSNESRLGSSSTASASPYVIAIQNAGIKVLPHVVNAAILTSALSAGVSDLFTATRTLHSMAVSGLAPRVFKEINRWGCPWRATLATWTIGLLAYLAVGSSSANIFQFLVKLTALSGVITWECIAVTYLRFRAGMKAQNIPHASLPWKSRFSTVGAWWIIVVISCVLLFSGWPVFRNGSWNTADFFGNYLPLLIFGCVYAGFKLGTKSKFVAAEDMDFITDLEDIERKAAQWEEEQERVAAVKGRNKVRAFFKGLVA